MPVALATAIVGASSGIAFTLVSSVISVGLSYLSKRLFTPSGGQDEQESIEQGVLANKVSNNSPIPVIYGYRKVGGSKIYQSVTNDNKDFWMAIVIGEGEIEGIEKIYIDGDEVILSANTADTHITVTDSLDSVLAKEIVTGTKYKITALATTDWSVVGGSSDAKVGDVFTATADRTEVQLNALGNAGEVKARYVGKCEFVYRTGSNTQTAISQSDFNNDTNFPTNWGSDKRLFGLSYILCKFTYDRDVFRGIPNITMDVKGIKVPDIKGTITNTKWDRNPAAVMYDYLTNTTYGRGLDSSLIDLDSFQDAYDTCETSLSITGTAPPKSLEAILGASEQKLYRLDGVLNVGENTFNNTKKILSACRGFLIFSAGKYMMTIDKYESDYSRTTVAGIAQTPSVTPFLFNEDNTIGAIDITLGDKSNTYNRARYSFYNPQKNWQYDTVYFDDATIRTNSDRGVVLEQSIRMDFVASRYCAQEIVRQNLRQSRQQIVVGFQTTISALANNVGDIVDISNENAGWTLKQFRILKLELQEDGNVKVVMVEYNPSVYDTSAAGLTFENDAPDTDLPNPFSTSLTPSEPTVVDSNLTGKSDAGTAIQVGRVKASWTAVEDPFIDYYELQYAVLDQEGSAVSSIVSGKAYAIASVTASDWSAGTVGGPSAAVVGDVFLAATSVSVSSLGTVKELTEDSAGYSTVNVPVTQVDGNADIIEFIENLSPTTGYAFRVRFVRTNSVYSAYSPVQRFVTAGVSSSAGASYLNVIEITSGNPEMQDNVGTVAYKSFLLKGGEKSPDMGDSGSEINSYDWFYTVSGGTKTQITNANKATVTGSTANNSLGGGGTNYNAATLTVEADGTALGTTGSGSVTFSCEIDYTPT
jgi:hypothetical protein